jgi:hypothetical protein
MRFKPGPVRFIVVCLAMTGSTLLAIRQAQACSYTVSEPPYYPEIYREWSIPQNAIFVPEWRGSERATVATIDEKWRTKNGTTIALTVDEGLSSKVGVMIYRATTPLHVGDELIGKRYRKEYRRVVATADTLAPEKPVISNSSIEIYREFADGCGCFCGNTESLSFDLIGKDDQAPIELLALLITTGQSVEEVQANDTYSSFLGAGREKGSLASHGQGGGIVWDPFLVDRARNDEPFCFAVSLMDPAGNIGPASEIECFDLGDPNDPRVERGSGGCNVITRSFPPMQFLWLAILLLQGRRIIRILRRLRGTKQRS